MIAGTLRKAINQAVTIAQNHDVGARYQQCQIIKLPVLETQRQFRHTTPTC